MNTYIVGECIKELSETMLVFTDRDDFIKEYKIEIGQTVDIYSTYPHWDERKEYYFFLHYKKITMNREQIEHHFKIIWEYGCYNTCIRDGIACKRIGHYVSEGTTSRDKYKSNCCNIGWEIGRGDCCMYEGL